MNHKNPAIAVHQLTKRFGDFTAVDSIDFEVYHGEIFGLLGPNGSGKTTTIRMMLGLLTPTSGTVDVLGLPVQKNIEKIQPRVGYMSQKFSLYNDLTVEQNLRFYGNSYGLSNTQLGERIQEALEMAGLQGREKVHTKDLSGGWRQRLALSAAILHQPEVLFLDEPTAGVDPISRRAFWDLLYKLITKGITVFITTHYMDEAEHCQRLAFIQRGQLIALGSPAQIKMDLMPGRVLEISPSDPIQAIKVLRSARQEGNLPVEDLEIFGSLIHVVAPKMKTIKKTIKAELRQANIDPGQMTIIEPSLEDVFVACMR